MLLSDVANKGEQIRCFLEPKMYEFRHSLFQTTRYKEAKRIQGSTGQIFCDLLFSALVDRPECQDSLSCLKSSLEATFARTGGVGMGCLPPGEVAHRFGQNSFGLDAHDCNCFEVSKGQGYFPLSHEIFE